MQTYKILDERKANSGPDGIMLSVVPLIESLEKPLYSLLRHQFPGIGHLKNQHTVFGDRQSYRNIPS